MRVGHSVLVAVALIAVGALATPARQESAVQAPSSTPAPANLDFEAGPNGGAPAGWRASTATTGYPAVATADQPHGGKLCAGLRADHPTASFGILMESIDARPYRGHRIRLRGSLRAKDARAQLWLRVDRAQGRLGFFDNMGQRPVVDDVWKDVETVADVDEDAESLNFGLLMLGGGATYIDDVAIDDLGAYVALAEPPRPLAGRGRANLEAFARLYGLVRHFHPSDQAAAADWNALALEGVRRCEGAPTPEALARALEDVFRPVAPTVRVVATGTALPVPAELASAPRAPGVRVVEWRHVGYGAGERGEIYESTRVFGPSGTHDPAHPLVVDLPGGVTAEVALALYADDGGTLPHVRTPDGAAPAQMIRYVGGDRATRLADVTIAWNVLAHFYPYFDDVSTDWPAQLGAALESAATDPTAEAFMLTLRRMVAALHDGHGGVAGPGTNEAAALPVLWDWIENRLVLTAVASDGAAGLVRGDVVESIDGTLAGDAIAAVERLTSSATPQWARVRALSELREGATGSTVVLVVRTGAGPSRSVTLARTVTGTELEEPRPAKIAEVRPGVFYVDLSRITDEDFTAALTKLTEAKGVVFDLRGYPRVSPAPLQHLSDAPLQSARWNVPIVTDPDWRRAPVWKTDGRWTLDPVAPRLKGKIAFLTDGRAISYAESWMGIVEAYRLGEIVGETTGGTNGDVNPITLPGGYKVFWTGMKVLKHDGSRHHGVGIVPTVAVSRTVKGVAEGRDEQLERAIEVVAQGAGGPPR